MQRRWDVASVPLAMQPLPRIGVENQTPHHRRTMVTATNIGRVEEGRSLCFTSMHLADASGELVRHTCHKLKYRRRPKCKPFPIADRTSIHSRPEQANGIRFGDFEMDLIVDGYNHAILTIVKRSTNMLFMTKLAHGKKS